LKASLRVIAGSLKGRGIRFVNSKFGNADITPQKVKGALFSILGESLEGLVFLDLYSGSGQIGIEAISRGSPLVVFNEFDRRRYLFIREFLEPLCAPESYLALNMKATAALKTIREKGIRPDIVFLDPPYDKDRTSRIYPFLLETFSEPGTLGDDPLIIIQHYSKNELPETAGMFRRRFTRKYGTTSLSVYEPAAGEISADAPYGHVGE
jgi:16S rRNA (guanine(966)-N(2))-methyltransferase RsmD